MVPPGVYGFMAFPHSVGPAVFLGSPLTLNTLLVPPGVYGAMPFLAVWDPRFSWAHRQPSTVWVPPGVYGAMAAPRSVRPAVYSGSPPNPLAQNSPKNQKLENSTQLQQERGHTRFKRVHTHQATVHRVHPSGPHYFYVWASTLWGLHPSGVHPSGPHPSGPSPFGAGAPPFGGSTLRGPTLCRPKFNIQKLAEVEIGRSQNWPKSKLAEVEIGRSRKKELAKS